MKQFVMTAMILVIGNFNITFAGVIHSDDFERTSLGPNYTGLNGSWSWGISNGKCTIGSDQGGTPMLMYNAFTIGQDGADSYVIDIDLSKATTNLYKWIGIAFHISVDANNNATHYYAARFRVNNSSGGDSPFQIWKNDSSWSITANSSAPLTNGKEYHITVSTDNAGSFSASLYDGSTSLATVSGTDDTPLTGGYVGFWDSGTQVGGDTWDNFVITTIPEPTTIGLTMIGLAGFGIFRRK